MAALCRSSRLEIFCKKGVFKDFEKFTGKTYVGVNKVAGVHPTTVQKKRFQNKSKCCEILKNTYFCRKPPVAASCP